MWLYGTLIFNVPCWKNCRRVADRSRDPANWSEIATVVDALSIPVIANGDVFEHDDFQRIRTVTGRQLLISRVETLVANKIYIIY